MKLFKFAVLAAALFASGCANEYGMAWQRMDGRPIDGSFDSAIAQCRRVASDYDEGAVAAMRRCMSRRGYVWAPTSG